MDTIAKIRAEIERLEGLDYPLDTYEQSLGFYDALDRIKAFLDTLEEPVSDCHDLEEAAEKFARFYDNGTCDGIAQDCFKAGAEWMKAKMMEGAVEGEIQMLYSGCLCAKTIRAINEDKFKFGDKVKIIIVKEEQQ